MKLALVVAMVAGMAGCIYAGQLPAIPHYHWRRSGFGATLYRDSDGMKSASFIEGVQICDFEASQCAQFETNQQMLDWLRLRRY